MRWFVAVGVLVVAACGDDGAATLDSAVPPGTDAGDASDGAPVDGGGSGDDAGGEVDAGVPPSDVFPGASWDTRDPADLGMDESALDDFERAIGGNGCFVKDGYMVRTWGDPSATFDWASASKPVTSTLLFFAIHEGRLSGVDALVADQGWALTPEDRTMTFRHLADMTSGYGRAEPPGAAWAYNDFAINLYKKTLFDRVFDDGTPADAAMRADRLGALGFEDGPIYGSRSGYGVDTSCRDFARIGWLWLNRGWWDGRQLLPRRFFDDYMQPDVANDLPRTTADGSDYLGVDSLGGGRDQTEYGPGIYGFNWWFNADVGTTGRLTWPDAPPDTFQANGHFDREIVTVIPSLGVVVAARGRWGSFEPGNASAGMNQNLALLARAAGP